MKLALTIIGTRPEAIKMAPVLRALNNSKHFESKVCITKQHTDLLEPILSSLGIIVNYHLESYDNERTLHQSAARILEQLGTLLTETNPDLVLVQGDTTTAFTGALAAYYSGIPVAHIEAGLRTGHLYSPWPEEAHRCLIDRLTTYFFAPTVQAQNTLLVEGVSPDKIWVVGNTSIDSIRFVRSSLQATKDPQKRIIIVTVHRRENHGAPLKEICTALRLIAEQFSDVHIILLLHPNPAVCLSVKEMLSGIRNIELREPADHSSFVQLLDACVLIITDSGGIQEEAPFMGKPLLIIRESTERPEGVEAGTARLVGTKTADIIAGCKELLENEETLIAMSKAHFPYGDGYAAERIVNILESEI